MHIISTGKTTILSDFADLETKSIYQHKNDCDYDFQFYGDSHVFVEVNKKSGLKLMRIKEKDTIGLEIQLIRKLKIKNAYCISCARQTEFDIAVGLSNGQVKIYNCKTSEMKHSFAGEKMKSVVFVDYNASDEYIAATHENGLINIYSNKTRTNLETINIDSHSSLARFHPTKRFHLAIASFKGAVSVYDTAAKRKIFHSIESHGAPCRDLSMSLSMPDTLISVGYDCAINIFDIRRKGQPLKLMQKHPLSTVALSNCGKFFCLGSLKGEVITYDMRNTKMELGLKKLHDGAVNRVDFLPEIIVESQSVSNDMNLTSDAIVGEASCSSASVECFESGIGVGLRSDTRQSLITVRGQRDSFCDFMDFQLNKGVEKASSRLIALSSRDSFDWEGFGNKPNWANRASVAYTGSNLSPIISNPNDSEHEAEINVEKGKENVIAEKNYHDENPKSILKQVYQPLREQNTHSTPDRKSIKIVEEQSSEKDFNSSDRENLNYISTLQKQTNTSTPIVGTPTVPLHNIVTEPSTSSPATLNAITKQIEDLRTDMFTRIKDLEYELKFEAEQNKWQIFSQSHNLFCKLYENVDDIRESMVYLLQTDPFVQEFMRLKEENQRLTEQLENFMKQQ